MFERACGLSEPAELCEASVARRCHHKRPPHVHQQRAEPGAGHMCKTAQATCAKRRHRARAGKERLVSTISVSRSARLSYTSTKSPRTLLRRFSTSEPPSIYTHDSFSRTCSQSRAQSCRVKGDHVIDGVKAKSHQQHSI